jgi:acetyltransferase-like isoleucine patch superfamily enzyme
MITIGRHTYVMCIQQYFDPVVNIGAFSSVADGVMFMGAGQHASILHREAVSSFPFKHLMQLDYVDEDYSRGPINIGNDVWIGQNAFIMDGVTIGNGAIIGACAVVAHDVLPYAVEIGNPSRVLRYRFEKDQISKLEQIQWWRWEDQAIAERIQDFKNINIFLNKYA